MISQRNIAYTISLLLLTVAWSTDLATAQANDEPEGIATHIPADWRHCTFSLECSVIPYSCSGRMAVNRRYKSQAEQIIYSTESSAWAACNMSVSAGMDASCRAHVCEVISTPDDIH